MCNLAYYLRVSDLGTEQRKAHDADLMRGPRESKVDPALMQRMSGGKVRVAGRKAVAAAREAQAEGGEEK